MTIEQIKGHKIYQKFKTIHQILLPPFQKIQAVLFIIIIIIIIIIIFYHFFRRKNNFWLKKKCPLRFEKKYFESNDNTSFISKFNI